MVTKTNIAKELDIKKVKLEKLAELQGVSTKTASRWRANEVYLKRHEGLFEIDGEPVILDRDIADTITILNRKGYKTVACCAGHEFDSGRPYISFESVCAPEIAFFPLSEMSGFYKDLLGHVTAIYFKDAHDLNLPAGQLQDCYAEYLAKLKDTLLKWAESLPTMKKEEPMRIYNVSKDKINYSQRNNEVNPSKSCNTTSMVMAASYLPTVWQKFTSSELYKKYSKKFKQPEDCLQQYMLDVGLRPTYHAELSKAMNDFCGSKVTKFSMTVTLATLVKELKEGRPVVISGDFPKSDGKTLGHVVCLAGCIFNNDNKTNTPDYWIIDDPYGDTMNDWKGSGNDVKLTHEDFMKYIKEKGQGKKWGHTFIV